MTHKRVKTALLTLTAGIACWTPGAWCASVAGRVTSGGQPAPGAQVQLNTGHVTETDARGRFSFPGVSKATYAVHVFAPDKQPLAAGGIVPGGGPTVLDLKPGDNSLGFVHVKAVRADQGSPCPIRLVTRWRAGEADEFVRPGHPQWASTLDGRAEPLVPSNGAQPFIVPRGACLWCQGEAIIALPPGEAELTCTSGPLMRVAQQTVTVAPGQVAEVEVTMALGAALRESGWVSGVAHCRVSSPGGRYLTNLPLAAGICRAEGLDWVAFSPEYGNDPEQADPVQVARELTTEDFHVWLPPDGPREPWGGTMVTIGPTDRQAADGAVPHHYQAAVMKKSVAIYTHALRTGPEDFRDSTGRPAFGDLATEMPFDLLADPSAVPGLDLRLTAPDRAGYFGLWTLLLDHGFRLAALSFTDACIDTGDLPVADRIFVHASLERGAAGVVEGIRRGATFASSGPVISFAIADAMPGETIPADDETRIADLDAWLGCVPGGGISRLELLRAGRVVRDWDISDVGPNHVQARIAIREREPTWFALRAHGVAAEGPGDRHVACTSPWYFRLPGEAPTGPLEAEIAGQVTDNRTGQPIAGARVTATTPEGGRESVTTGADGQYRLAASAASMVEAEHPQYQRVDRPMTRDGGVREDNTTKFVAWDCLDVFGILRFASRDDLQDRAYYERLRERMAAPRLDFALTPRR